MSFTPCVARPSTDTSFTFRRITFPVELMTISSSRLFTAMIVTSCPFRWEVRTVRTPWPPRRVRR